MASVRDVILIGVLVFAFSILIFVVNFSAKTMINAIVSVPNINNTSPHATATFNALGTSVDRMDYIILGLFIGFVFALIITGYYVGGEPIFMFFYFLITGVGIFLSMILSNVWYNISQASIFGTTVQSLPISNHIMTFLPYYTIGFGVLGVIIMFAKPYIKGVLQ